MSTLVDVALGFVLVLTMAVMVGVSYYALYRVLKVAREQRSRRREAERAAGMEHRSPLHRWHQELREEGTTGPERAFLYLWFLLTLTLGPAGVVLLVVVGARAAGLAVLVAALLQMATPMTPLLRARLRGRERRQRGEPEPADEPGAPG